MTLKYGNRDADLVANTRLDVSDIVRLKVTGIRGTRRIHNTYTRKSGTVPEQSADVRTFLLLGYENFKVCLP